jgi:hypothetical protein
LLLYELRLGGLQKNPRLILRNYLNTTRTGRFTDFIPKQLEAIYKKVPAAERQVLSALCLATAEYAKDNKKGLASIIDVRETVSGYGI